MAQSIQSQHSGARRLRHLRNMNAKTQLEVELDASLGIGYLQRLELGKVRQPERETLERILDALNARYTERHEVLESFGYVVNTPLPSLEDVRWAQQTCQDDLEKATFPAYLLDCTHRLLAWNPIFEQLFRRNQFLDSPAQSDYVSLPKVFFDPHYQITPAITNADDFFAAQIRVLHYEMQWFRDADWYGDFIEDMREYTVFDTYWHDPTNESVQIPARPLTPLKIELDGEGVAAFRLIAEPFVRDRRFRVIYYLPADVFTMQQCERWLESS